MSSVAIDGPVLVSGFVSEEEFAAAAESVRTIRFGFGAISTDPELPIWRGDIDKESPPVQLALRTVCALADATFDLVSCHINLQTHGLDGAFHTDGGDRAGNVTHALTWYIHEYEWLIEYGGYLIVGHDASDLRAILPARNSAVLMPSEIPHCALSPSMRAGHRARVSLALKLRLRNEI